MICLYRVLYFLWLSHLFLNVIATNTRCFWQVTDFHHDPNYTTNGDPGNPQDRTMCHLRANYTSGMLPGKFGDYLCDAPWTLVREAVKGMHHIEPNPDFILWTGDDPPHVPVSTLNSNKVLGIISNVTNLIFEYFPGIRVFPVLGNHDYYPKGQMPPNNENDEIYEAIGNMWTDKSWLGEGSSEQVSKFKQGGFYETVYQVPDSGQTLRMIGLNTVYYYHQDSLTEDVEDPAEQFKWLLSIMDDARQNSQKVYLFGHVPPGMFERSRGTSWFYANFNTRFVQFIVDNSDIIAGLFFAHQHSDSFKLFYVANEIPVAVMYLAPSVTPWKTTLEGVSANNPSIRLYEYDPKTGNIINIRQYYTNLTEANLSGNVTWRLEYSATTVYRLENVNSSSFGSLVDSFLDSNNNNFNHYYEYNAVSYDGEGPCDEDCKTTQICSIVCPLYDQYERCLKDPDRARQLCVIDTSPSSSDSSLPLYGDIFIGVFAGLMVLVGVFAFLVCAGRRKRKVGFRVESKEPLLSDSDKDV